MAAPSVSVVVPLYNKRPYVERALRSIYRQTYQNFTVVVVDDGSTDGGTDIVREVADSRTTLIVQANKGEAGARNRGILATEAPLLAFLDADDEWFPNFLEDLLSLLESHPEAVAAGGSFVRDNGLPEYDAQDSDVVVMSNYLAASRATNYRLRLLPSAAVARRDALIAAGLFPLGIKVGGDTDTWMRLSWLGAIVYSPRPVTRWHDATPGNTMTSRRPAGPEYPVMPRTYREWARAGRIPAQLMKDSGVFVLDQVYLQWKLLMRESRRAQALRVLWRNREFVRFGSAWEFRHRMLETLPLGVGASLERLLGYGRRIVHGKGVIGRGGA